MELCIKHVVVSLLTIQKLQLHIIAPPPFLSLSVFLSCRKSISELDPRKIYAEEKVSLHQTPDPGAGEGVPL